MAELLQEWGLEILFSLISLAAIGYAKWHGNKLKTKLENSNKYEKNQEQDNIDSSIEIHLEPIYEELEDLRKYIRTTEDVEKTHMNLIIASYRFRLVQLCKGFLKQKYITPEQIEQLTEFYKVYTGLGGNGAAKVYYDKAMALPTEPPEKD